MAEKKRAAALGFFDGIHIGHAALMRRLVEVSRQKSLTATVITFDILPQNLTKNRTTPLINLFPDKQKLITDLFGIENIIPLHFDEVMAAMPWERFIDLLTDEYNVSHIIAGSNFRFGKGAQGDSKLLMRRCADNNTGCDIISDVMLNGVVISSTYIRELLLKGDIERANAFLGHRHMYTGIVHSGRGLGRTLGVPTINMSFSPGVLIPAHGVYITKALTEKGGTYPGVTNIGIRPTVDNTGTVTVETHIPGFSDDLYGQQVRIEFYKYLRKEIKFNNTDELKEQIKKDCLTVEEYFSR